MRLLLLFALLLPSGNNFFAQDIFGAARKGDTLLIQKIISLKKDTINSRNEAGFTPLILATYHHQENAVQFLLKNGAEANLSSPEGPALLATCFRPNKNLAALLLKAGADVNGTNPEGVSALMFAVMSNDLAVFNLLIETGANRGQKDRRGRTALEYCSPITPSEMRDALTK